MPANGSVGTVTLSPRYVSQVRDVLGREQFDLLHFHEPFVPFLSPIILRLSTSVNIATFHAYSGFSPAYELTSRLLGPIVARLHGRIAVSAAARHFIDRYFPGDYKVIPNGVDVARFATAAPYDLGVGSNVLFFGRMERRKGLEVLVQAMTRLRDLDARLVVAGGGPEEHKCRNLARRLGVDATWLGSPHDDEKPGIFQAGQVYCAPNLGGESFGIVLVEAMAAGAPVVCSDLPGFRAVAGDAGLLAPPGDAGALADALRAVLTDPARAKEMSAAGLGVAESFDWRRLSADVERVYDRALAAWGTRETGSE
jgi:phosphatidylinositol alpha-mannosyltransferase